MIWTDKIRQVKIALMSAAVLIAGVSLVVSHFLVKDLAREERRRMEIWAEAIRTLSVAESDADLNLVLKVLEQMKSRTTHWVRETGWRRLWGKTNVAV